MNHAIRVDGLTKRFGRTVAVHDVSYEIPEGSVCGLLGQNGAGKTTSIRMMLDLLRPSEGSIRVLGLDSVDDSVQIRRRVGYLPEEPTYLPWMTVDEILAFNAGFFPTWDRDLARRLVRDLSLPGDRRLHDLSRGMRAKVGLAMAVAQRPELLLLDDPTSGLDPIVRREFLETVIENVQAEGGTVLFSTHLLHEMERVADRVLIQHEGELLLSADVESLKASRRRLRAVFSGPVPELDQAGLEPAGRTGHHALFTTREFHPGLVTALGASGFDDVEVLGMDLEEIFIDEVRRRTGVTHESPTDWPVPASSAA